MACSTRQKTERGAAQIASAPGGLAPWQEKRAKALILARLGRAVSLAELARETGLSRSHFARAFHRSVGVPPHRWLMAQRIDHARRHLLEPDLPVSLVASLCGFSDQSHFARAFRAATGLSPIAWRRQAARSESCRSGSASTSPSPP